MRLGLFLVALTDSYYPADMACGTAIGCLLTVASMLIPLNLPRFAAGG
jgi:hypothetical protein